MVGRVSLIMVLSYTTLFLLIGMNFNSFNNRAVDNTANYFNFSRLHNITVSGANIACSNLYFDKTWTPTSAYLNVPFNNGTFSITMKDTLTNFKMITVVGNYLTYSKTIRILLQPSNFAKFGNFYNVFGAAAATGDTFSGPFHANDYCNVYGNPVFQGKVTCLKGLKKSYNPSNPQFLGGFESGVNIPLEFDTSGLAAKASTNGRVLKGTTAKSFIEVDMTFNNNGTMTYKRRIGTSSTSYDAWSADTTVNLTTFAPNGIIYVEKGNVTMKGVLDGKVTVVSTRKGASGMGCVYIPSDLTYKSNPITSGDTTDMLGIVAEEKVEIPYVSTRGDINIHASMYAQRNGLSVASISSYTGVFSMKILGGVIAQNVLGTAQYSGGVPVKGLRFVHTFDERFLLSVPPSFPQTKFYEIMSWLE